jgi:hypothetical protein
MLTLLIIAITTLAVTGLIVWLVLRKKHDKPTPPNPNPPPPPHCTPDCTGKQCGPDGCGSMCGECPENENCNDDGQCISDCDPPCEGNDVCINSQCVCQPNCNKQGYECGESDCPGVLCGTCDSGQVCKNHQCVTPPTPCVPSCVEGACNVDDGCGSLCTCPAGQVCSDNTCITPPIPCVPNCPTGSCNISDGCGGICSCPSGSSCVNNKCCKPSCGSSYYGSCGSDGCGGKCSCKNNSYCTNYTCRPN